MHGETVKCLPSTGGRQLALHKGMGRGGPAPTLSSSFLLAQAIFEPKLFPV